MIERDRRVSRFDDAKSIPRTSLSGLNGVGRRASLYSADQFCRESRRQPINVTTARRLTLASCKLYVYVCVRAYMCLCAYVRAFRFESALFWSTPCWNDTYFTMVLGSSCYHFCRSPVSPVMLYGYRLYAPTIWTIAIFRWILNQCLIWNILARCQSSAHSQIFCFSFRE